MPRRRLTDKTIENLPRPPAKKQVDYWDMYLPGFGIRVSYNGSKAWICQPRVLQKGTWKTTRVTFGRYPTMRLAEARDMAGDLMALAKGGGDPREVLRAEKVEMVERSATTFESVAKRFMADYIERRGLRPNTANVYRWMFEGADVTRWKDRPVSEITRKDVQKVVDAIIDRGSPVAANRTLRYLRTFFGWCEARGLIEAMPTDKVVTDVVEQSRDRVLTPSEIAEVWRALDTLGGVFGDAFKLFVADRPTARGSLRHDVGGTVGPRRQGASLEPAARANQEQASPLGAAVVGSRCHRQCAPAYRRVPISVFDNWRDAHQRIFEGRCHREGDGCGESA